MRAKVLGELLRMFCVKAQCNGLAQRTPMSAKTVSHGAKRINKGFFHSKIVRYLKMRLTNESCLKFWRRDHALILLSKKAVAVFCNQIINSIAQKSGEYFEYSKCLPR